MNERQADAWLEQAFAQLFEDEPPVVLDWADVMRGDKSDLLHRPPGRAPVRRLRRRTQLALGLVVLVALLIPAGVLAARSWLVVGTRTPPTLRQAIAARQPAAPALARAYRLDPAASRVVAQAQTSRGPLFVIAGPSLRRHVTDALGNSVSVYCGGLVFGFRPLSPGARSVIVGGTRYWVDANGACGGAAPASTRQPAVVGGGWELVDEHLAVAFGRLAGGATEIEAVHADGQHTTAPTWDGYFAIITADDGRPPGQRVTRIMVRNSHNGAIATPFAAALGQPLPSQHPVLGTSVGDAYILPGHVTLRPSRSTTVGHARELVVTIYNSGSVRITGGVRVVIRVGARRYQTNARPTLPDATATVRVGLPQDLAGLTRISVETHPLRGERNVTNNHRTWKVTFAKAKSP
jgi:hypothetical protein